MKLSDKMKQLFKATVAWILLIPLKCADDFAQYILFLLITYLTDTWDLGFAHAAGIINIFYGVSKLLNLGCAYLGNFKMLSLSSVVYNIGLAFLSISTPPVLSKASGNCRGYKAECVGPAQKGMFYTSLVLIAVGMAGHAVSVDPFCDEQTKAFCQRSGANAATEEGEGKDAGCCNVTKIADKFYKLIITAVAGLVLPYVHSWAIKFGAAAIYTFMAITEFFAGAVFGIYEYGDKPKGSALTIVFRVFVAAAYKICHQTPDDPRKLYEGNDNTAKRLPHTDRLRCLDKAAIVLAEKSGSEDQVEEMGKNRWKLCTVTEVEETKIAVLTAPLWISFIMCGVVSSIGNTFFVAQAAKMKPGIGKWQVPLTILRIISQMARPIIEIYNECVYKFIKKHCKMPLAPMIGMGIALFNTVLCCLIAAVVEHFRLKDINGMSIFWLVFQFEGLVIIELWFKVCAEDFFATEAPKSMKKYRTHIMNFVSGLGYMGSVLSVFIVANISKRGGRRNWFQKTVNESRLDNYYWTLTALSAINFIWYAVTAVVHYRREKSPKKSADQPGRRAHGGR